MKWVPYSVLRVCVCISLAYTQNYVLTYLTTAPLHQHEVEQKTNKRKRKDSCVKTEWRRQTWSTDDWSYWVPPILHKPIVWWQNGELPLCIHFPQAPFNPPSHLPPLLPRGRSINNTHARPVEGREQGRREAPRPLPRAPNITARPSVITPTLPGVNATLWPARGWDHPGV